MKLKKMTTLSLLCALAMLVNFFAIIPLVPTVPWLLYDPKDVVIVFGGLIYGPFACCVMSLICSLLEMMLKGGTFLNVFMNVISTCSFACVTVFFYYRHPTFKGLIFSLCGGVLCMTFTMTIYNYLVTPFYYHMTQEAVIALLLPGIIPFNILKSSLNAMITIVLYKSIHPMLKIYCEKNRSYHMWIYVFIVLLIFSLLFVIL